MSRGGRHRASSSSRLLGVGSGLRTLLVVLLGLVAALTIPLSVVSWWTVNTVASTSRYEATLEPLAQNQSLIAYLSGLTSRSLYSALPPDESSLDHDPAVETAMTKAVSAAYGSEQFRQLWNREVGSSHEVVKQILLTRSEPQDLEHGWVVNLSPVIDTAVANLDAADVHQFDAVAADLVNTRPLEFQVLSAQQVKEARNVFSRLNGLHVLLPIVALVTLVGAIALGRHRLLVLAGVATGTVVTTGLCLIGLAGTEALALHRAISLEVNRTISHSVFSTLDHYLWRDLYLCLGIAVIVALASWIGDWRWSKRHTRDVQLSPRGATLAASSGGSAEPEPALVGSGAGDAAGGLVTTPASAPIDSASSGPAVPSSPGADAERSAEAEEPEAAEDEAEEPEAAQNEAEETGAEAPAP